MPDKDGGAHEQRAGRGTDGAVVLPPMFDVRRLTETADVGCEAARLAGEGASEGTLLWAVRQDDARSLGGKPWYSPAGNLHCALVLEPEYPNAQLRQLAFVATVAAGEALASVLEPMTGLRYRWPTTLLINELVAGYVRLRAPALQQDPLPWLVVATCINVAHHPVNPEPDRYNSVHASGSPQVSVGNLLEDFARYFLRWINIWAEDGFDPVRRAYSMRADGFSAPQDGVSASLDDDAVATFADANGNRCTRDVSSLFGLPAIGAA